MAKSRHAATVTVPAATVAVSADQVTKPQPETVSQPVATNAIPEKVTETVVSDKSLMERVREICENIGEEVTAKNVIETLKSQGIEFSENTVKAYTSAIRSELGYSTPRSGSTSEPTITDLMNARQLCADINMTTKQLVAVANAIVNNFGDAEKLVKCLNALDEFSSTATVMQRKA